MRNIWIRDAAGLERRVRPQRCEQYPDIMGGMKPYFDPNAEKSAWFTHGYAADRSSPKTGVGRQIAKKKFKDAQKKCVSLIFFSEFLRICNTFVTPCVVKCIYNHKVRHQNHSETQKIHASAVTGKPAVGQSHMEKDMSKQLFKKNSMDRVSSPEQLHDYVKVANPGLWMVISAIVILLAGIVVWGIIGKIDSTLTTAIVADGGHAVIYIGESDVEKLEVGMTVRSEGKEYRITDIAKEPVKVDESLTDYAMHASGLAMGEWVYVIEIDGEHSDGVHKADIVIESISPISFILN